MKSGKTEAAILDWLGEGAELIDTINDDPQPSHQSTIDQLNINNVRSSFVRKTESFELIPSTKCCPWNYADRSEAEMGDLKSLEDSIKNHGQLEPILVRPCNKDTSIKYEIIFGNRRWRACHNLNVPIKAIVKNLSDQESAIAQKEENENRKGISYYSRAIFYKKLLNDGVFVTEKDLADSMKIPKQTLNDIMSYTRIDETLLNKLQFPHKLSKKMASKLATLSKKISLGTLSPSYVDALYSILPDIDAKKISYRTIDTRIEKLTLLPENNGSSIKKADSSSLFKITTDSFGNVNIFISNNFLNNCSICDIEKALSELQSARADRHMKENKMS